MAKVHLRRWVNKSSGSIVPPERVEQLAVLDRDLKVARERQLLKDPVGLLHRKLALKRRLYRRQLPTAPECQKQLFLLYALDYAAVPAEYPRLADPLAGGSFAKGACDPCADAWQGKGGPRAEHQP